MPKNKGKGGKKRRRGKNENEMTINELVEKDGKEQEYAQVTKMLGGNRLLASCFDGKTRLCRIRGRLTRKMWIEPGNIILIGLRTYQDEKADVILKYSDEQVTLLKSSGQLPETVTEDLGGEQSEVLFAGATEGPNASSSESDIDLGLDDDSEDESE